MGRIKKARNTWHLLSKKLPNYTKIKTRTKIRLWNPLVRSTLTYVMQTREIALPDQKYLESCTFARIRQIQNRYWYKKTRKPLTHETQYTLRQPTTISWVDKLRLIHMIRKTKHGRNIHHTNNHYVTNTIDIYIWNREWGTMRTNKRPTKT